MLTFDPGGRSDRGALGWRELVKARPDGYLIAGINIPHIILQPLQQEVGYKTDQIVPISLFQRTLLGLAVRSTSALNTLAELRTDGKPCTCEGYAPARAPRVPLGQVTRHRRIPAARGYLDGT